MLFHPYFEYSTVIQYFLGMVYVTGGWYLYRSSYIALIAIILGLAYSFMTIAGWYYTQQCSITEDQTEISYIPDILGIIITLLPLSLIVCSINSLLKKNKIQLDT